MIQTFSKIFISFPDIIIQDNYKTLLADNWRCPNHQFLKRMEMMDINLDFLNKTQTILVLCYVQIHVGGHLVDHWGHPPPKNKFIEINAIWTLKYNYYWIINLNYKSQPQLICYLDSLTVFSGLELSRNKQYEFSILWSDSLKYVWSHNRTLNLILNGD